MLHACMEVTHLQPAWRAGNLHRRNTHMVSMRTNLMWMSDHDTLIYTVTSVHNGVSIVDSPAEPVRTARLQCTSGTQVGFGMHGDLGCNAFYILACVSVCSNVADPPMAKTRPAHSMAVIQERVTEAIVKLGLETSLQWSCLGLESAGFWQVSERVADLYCWWRLWAKVYPGAETWRCWISTIRMDPWN